MMQVSCGWQTIPILARGLLAPWSQALVQQPQQARSSRTEGPARNPGPLERRGILACFARRPAASSGPVVRGVIRLSARDRPSGRVALFRTLANGLETLL